MCRKVLEIVEEVHNNLYKYFWSSFFRNPGCVQTINYLKSLWSLSKVKQESKKDFCFLSIYDNLKQLDIENVVVIVKWIFSQSQGIKM